ncbi:TldD/PmbA family protein [Butyrivibrio sp. JL13D10]|uniref:TldD/PmbA family protein n=1 Tax=Butyrivibrio sp. JL13D10 TaxID=3236815 RepID=UPI0038B5E9D2
MANIRDIADKTYEYVKGIDGLKADFTISETETNEITMKDGKFTLFRTLFDQDVSVKVIRNNKRGLGSINKCTEEDVKKAIDDALVSAEAGDEDENFDIAPGMEPQEFKMGVLEPDIDKFMERIEELSKAIAEKHKKIKVMEICAKYVKSYSTFRNTNGTLDETEAGYYSIMVEFAGSDGDETTGISGTSVVFDNLDKELITLGSIEKDLSDAENSLSPISLQEKFTGEIIFTPACVSQMLFYTFGNTVIDSAIIGGTSVWRDKVGERVVSDKLTISSNPWDKRIIVNEVHTQDGFRSEDYTLIEKGELKCFATSLYAANKCKVNRAANSSVDLVIEAGDVSYEDMVKSVKKGLIVGSVSCGMPGPNGEISGVAKNSFYVENGEIKGAVIETMISTNLFDMFNRVKAVSTEQLCNGMMVVPYIQCEGVTISGKTE